MENVFIGAVGAYVPGSSTVAAAVENGWMDAAEANASGLLGVATAGRTPAPEMAVEAARQALARWGHDASALGLLLYVDVYHSGPQGWLPQSHVMRHVVGGELLAVGVRQGCNGVFGALELAAAHLRGADSEAALITAADNMNSPQVDRWKALPGFLLGDGASALVLSRTDGFARLLSVNTVAVPALEGVHRGTQPLFPSAVATGQALDFRARQEEFSLSGEAPPDGGLQMMKIQAEVVDRTLAEAGTEVGELARVAFPHGSREILEDRWMTPLGLPLERSTWEYGRRVGHLGASDQVAAFEHLLATEQVGPGDKVLLVGIGPGVGIAAAVVEILETPSW
ncbi:ketoacyl-ACP synthase III family protein [Kitasatospora phosalacinea]|uniref:ketoacyl-ACP synthase III family protein n=1 Tax=Kitasatospora phosalacinea TaxID=2065 RepID=UPI00255360BA|nr:ketoacyl-ACP synthase III family protein [Kitasatospora phosalacinea]